MVFLILRFGLSSFLFLELKMTCLSKILFCQNYVNSSFIYVNSFFIYICIPICRINFDSFWVLKMLQDFRRSKQKLSRFEYHRI